MLHSSPTPSPAGPGQAEAGLSPAPKVWKNGALVYTSGGLVALFVLLLLGDFACSMRDRSVQPMAAWYLKQLGVPNVLFALLLSSFPSLLGLILSPIVSVKSDRHRGPRGRRIPFLLLTTPLVAVGMIGLAFTPLIARGVHAMLPGQSDIVVAVVCFVIFWALFDIAAIASGAVFGGLINDVVPRELLGRFYGLFRAVSLIDGIIFNYWIFGHVKTHFTVILASISLFYGICFFWVCLKIREGNYPPPPPRELRRFAGFSSYFRECFTRPYYVGVFVMITAAMMVFMPVNTFMIPYAESLGMDMDRYAKCMALTYAISLVIAFPLGWLCDIFHPMRMSMLCLLGYAGVTAWGVFNARTPDGFAIALVAHGVLSGCYYTAAASLGARLYPASRFAQFASAAGIVGSLGAMIINPLIGGLIDATGNLYYHTFTVGCAMAVLALLISLGVYWRFMQLGGPRNYVPPE